MSDGEIDNRLLIDKYRLIAEIARGGMADVYLAVNKAAIGGFQKLVVVKLLRESLAHDEDCVRMFLDEARLAARLNHPNVVQTNEVGAHGGRYFLIMEYLEGQTLERIIRHPAAPRRFPLSMCLQTLRQALTGLQYAHDLVDYDGRSLCVVHRDVSPSNIFVTYQGHTKVVDFGIAKVLDSTVDTRVGVFKGKARYIAPEQISHSSGVDRRSDIYAMGVVLWEILSGQRMWRGLRSVDVLRRVLAGEVPSLREAAPDVPEELERICSKALARSRDDRYPTASAFEADLHAFAAARASPPSDREMGDALKEMFSEDRLRMRVAIEGHLKHAPATADLPAIHASPEGASSTSSSLSPGESSLPTVSSAPWPVGAEGDQVAVPVAGSNPAPKPARTRLAFIAAAAGAQCLLLVGLVVWIASAWSAGKKREPSADRPGSASSPAARAESAPQASSADPPAGEAEFLCGMSAAFSGPSREMGMRMKLGVETAFSLLNDEGGVWGRKLRLLALDDGYEGGRAGDNMRELLDRRGVFAVLGNVGTPTAQVAAPYAVGHKTIFFGALTGSKVLRQEPPERYVFNYRASYEEETAKMVHYLLDAKRLSPSGVVVFAQHDGYGDAGFEGVAKTMRKYGRGDGDILRVQYERNTVDVDGAVREVIRYHESTHRVSAVILVATYKAAARFIQKVKDRGLDPKFLNVSFVGSTALLEELNELGPSYAPGVIVTQVVPHYESGATAVRRFRDALTRYHPDQQADFVSLEGYVVGQLFAEGLRRAGPRVDTEKVVDALESIHDYDMGMGTILNFSLSEHQASHKVWGTIVDPQGHFQPFDME
jgi:branched-chain amino acid transport system substrate-binding protein